jgi:hypothetical protein
MGKHCDKGRESCRVLELVRRMTRVLTSPVAVRTLAAVVQLATLIDLLARCGS